MVRWEPISGIIPPISATEWQKEFDHYREYPEYQKINAGMTLDEFKSIFYFEWAHRVLGRIIGFVFFVGFLWLLLKRQLTRSLIPHLVVMFVLGGLQGLLGWYMVKSGLVNNPDVSQYRLTAHLGTAILIYLYMLWVSLGSWNGNRQLQSVRAFVAERFGLDRLRPLRCSQVALLPD